MQAGGLDRVDHVVEPLPGRRAAAAQPGQLAVGGVEGVAEHQAGGHGQRRADHEGRTQRQQRDAGDGEGRADPGDRVRGQAGVEGQRGEQPAELAVDEAGVRRRTGGALLRAGEPAQRRAAASPPGRGGVHAVAVTVAPAWRVAAGGTGLAAGGSVTAVPAGLGAAA